MINRVYKATLQQMGGGTEEIQKGDEVTPIKYGTFHYAATAGNPAKYGKGGAFSSYIEFEYYTSGGVTLNKGDMLLYAQEWDTDTSFADITPSREQGINVFYVTEIKEKRETIYILAYDLVEYLLDVDFSQTLKANEANFPMTIESLYGLVQTLTGVYAPWHSIALVPPDRSNFWKTAKVGYFYSSNITARDILNWIGEIIGQSLLFLWDGDFSLIGTSRKTIHKTFTNAGNNYWKNANKYIVCPDDGTYTIDGNTAINAWYKENGLEVGKAFTTYDGVELIASDGSVLGSYYTATHATNVLRIVGNMIVENIIEFGTFQPETIPPTYGTYNDLAQDILAGANVVSGMNYAKVQLFPFRCPYTIGSRMYCVDRDGNTFIVPIMSIDLTESEVVIGAYGNEYATDSNNDTIGGGGGSSDPAIWSKINKIESRISKGWETAESLHAGTYGTLMMIVNHLSGVGILKWNGNASTPPAGTTIIASIAPYRSLFPGLGNALRHGDQITIEADGETVKVWLTNTSWSNGELVFPFNVDETVGELIDGNGDYLVDGNGDYLVAPIV